MFVTLAIWFFFSSNIYVRRVGKSGIVSWLPISLLYVGTRISCCFRNLIFWFANKQEKIDDEHGYGGEKEDD